jgi:hypothetical protein
MVHGPYDISELVQFSPVVVDEHKPIHSPGPPAEGGKRDALAA